MTSLQIRELPELEQAVGGDAKQRRAAALQRIAAHWQGRPPVVWPESPEALIRADRER